MKKGRQDRIAETLTFKANNYTSQQTKKQKIRGEKQILHITISSFSYFCSDE